MKVKIRVRDEDAALVGGIDGGPGLVEKMATSVFGNGRDWIAPALAAIVRLVHRNRCKRVETAIAEEKDL